MSSEAAPSGADLSKLELGEIWWKDHQEWLHSKGYALRPRYHPHWKPSWGGNMRRYLESEDRHASLYSRLLDATRISDDTVVQLKLVERGLEEEVDIIRHFSSEPLISDRRNHCVPLLDVLDPEKDPRFSMILVMPLLRSVNSPLFETVGEVVECLRQVFETIQFMHKNNYAHRDIAVKNIMLDASPLYHQGFHPHVNLNDMRRSGTGKATRRSRTQAPVNYYIIDFGLSWEYERDSKGPPVAPLIHGNDRTVPEFRRLHNGSPYNPFPTDIYYLGNFVRREFLNDKVPLDFLDELVKQMTATEPETRPTIDSVVAEYEMLVRSLTEEQLRSRVRKGDETPFVSFGKDIQHWLKTKRYIMSGTPAIPTATLPSRGSALTGEPLPAYVPSDALSSSRMRPVPSFARKC